MWEAGAVLTDTAIADLRTDLLAADYTLSGVGARLGDAALAGIGRNTSALARRVLAEDRDPQADAIRLWLLQQAVPRTRLASWRSLPALLDAGLLTGDTELRAQVEIKPHGTDEREGWICSDQTPLDGQQPPPRPDFVLGASPASTTLAQLVPPGHRRRVLDLGTGCGIQCLSLDADQIIATDLNPRALALARITLGLSGVDAELRAGSVYEPVIGEHFDLILTNPPYVLSPPSAEPLVYRETGFSGDELMRQVVTGATGHLAPGGQLVVLGNWAHTSDQDWQSRLTEWIAPSGCDALVLQREILDPGEYIEIWLADAGLLGDPRYLDRYLEWLDYFAAQQITAVGMGWIVLSNSGRTEPRLRFQDWPHLVHQPVGAALGDHLRAIDASLDPDFAGCYLRLHPQVVQETIGEPGAPDPQHLILRQPFGLGRAVEVDTALAAVVGACDGELPVAVLLSAAAQVLGVEEATLATQVVPRLRELVADGFLLT